MTPKEMVLLAGPLKEQLNETNLALLKLPSLILSLASRRIILTPGLTDG